MPIGYKIVQKALLNIFLELHSSHKKLLQSPLLQKVSLVHKKSAGTSELLLLRGSRLPIQDNKHFPRAHEVYIADIYNKDTGVQ